MNCTWDIEKIKTVLPQRYPFLFVDKVMEIKEKDKKIICLKNLSINENFFQGHFPGNPIMPGAIIIEAMAQASILLFAVLKPQVAEKHPTYYLGKVEAKFIKPVKAGDQLFLEVHGEKVLDRGGIVKVHARVGEDKVAEAQIVFGVKPKNE